MDSVQVYSMVLSGQYLHTSVDDVLCSISALQWLCNADRKDHQPHKRLYLFFSSLYACLVRLPFSVLGIFDLCYLYQQSRGARAVFQFYPENPDQVQYKRFQDCVTSLLLNRWSLLRIKL